MVPIMPATTVDKPKAVSALPYFATSGNMACPALGPQYANTPIIAEYMLYPMVPMMYTLFEAIILTSLKACLSTCRYCWKPDLWLAPPLPPTEAPPLFLGQ